MKIYQSKLIEVIVYYNSKAKRDFDFDFGDEEYYIRLNCAILQKSESWQEKV